MEAANAGALTAMMENMAAEHRGGSGSETPSEEESLGTTESEAGRAGEEDGEGEEEGVAALRLDALARFKAFKQVCVPLPFSMRYATHMLVWRAVHST
jgi:hypothetical protein